MENKCDKTPETNSKSGQREADAGQIQQSSSDAAEATTSTSANVPNEDPKNRNWFSTTDGALPDKPPTVTVKEILSEILDCTVMRKLPGREHNDLVLSELKPESTSGITVKEILGEILNYSVCRQISEPGCREAATLMESACAATSSAQQFIDLMEPGTSVSRELKTKQHPSEVGIGQKEYKIYRALNAEPIVKEPAVETSKITSLAAKSLKCLLPTYSAVLKLGPPPAPQIKIATSSHSFIPPLPPPPYAALEGVWNDGSSIVSSESMIFGPDPLYLICPRCRVQVVTSAETEHSALTHMMAMVLCLCFCWPCCLIPYCLKCCRYSYHSCPNCRHYFGMHAPY